MNRKELTIENIVDLLKQSGVNSKRQVIEWLTNATIDDLTCLARDCNTRIGEIRVGQRKKRL